MELIKIDGLAAIVDTVQKLLSTTTGIVILSIFVFVSLIVKIPQIPLIQSFNERKVKRLKFFQDHFASITDEKFCKTVVEDVRNAIIFEHATKIYAEHAWRKGLVELHDKTCVSWITVKRARRLWRFVQTARYLLRNSHYSISSIKFSTIS